MCLKSRSLRRALQEFVLFLIIFKMSQSLSIDKNIKSPNEDNVKEHNGDDMSRQKDDTRFHTQITNTKKVHH